MANATPKAIFVKRTSIRIPPKGKLAGPLVAITEGGVMTLSVAASKVIGTAGRVFFQFYPESRKLVMIPKGHKSLPKDVLDEWGYEVRKAKKSNSLTISNSNSFLQDLGHDVFEKDSKYDFRKSGNQTFPANTDGGMVSFTLPVGALNKREVVKRAPRKKKVQSITAETNAQPTPEVADIQIAEDEPVMVSA